MIQANIQTRKQLNLTKIILYLQRKVETLTVFFNQSYKDFYHTGAISPSSGYLAEVITNLADLSEKRCIVELGSGTGIFTQKIMLKKSEASKFFALEINKYFVNETKKNCPNANVYNDDARNIQRYLTQFKESHCDCIISGLPWSDFDDETQMKLIKNIYDSLENGGEFLTFSYLHSLILPRGKKFKELLNKRFKLVIQTKTIWWNLPPCFIYYCKK